MLTMLPSPVQSRQRFTLRALLGHCLYRRLILWCITVSILLCLILFGSGDRSGHGGMMGLVDFRKGSQSSSSKTTTGTFEQKVALENHKGNSNWHETGRDPLHWLDYKQ